MTEHIVCSSANPLGLHPLLPSLSLSLSPIFLPLSHTLSVTWDAGEKMRNMNLALVSSVRVAV